MRHAFLDRRGTALADEGEVGRRPDEPADDQPRQHPADDDPEDLDDPLVDVPEGEGHDDRRHDVRKGERRREVHDRQHGEDDPAAGEKARQCEQPPRRAPEADEERGEEHLAPAHGLAVGADDGPAEAPTSALSWLRACWTSPISVPYRAKSPSRRAC
jgi:hypothetical protein